MHGSCIINKRLDVLKMSSSTISDDFPDAYLISWGQTGELKTNTFQTCRDIADFFHGKIKAKKYLLFARAFVPKALSIWMRGRYPYH